MSEAQKGHAPFVHLRAHTAYSLLEGALRIKELPKLCRAHGMPALAMTDTGNLFGAFEFSQTLAKAGVQPVIGCSLRVDISKLAGVARRALRRVRDEVGK